MSVCLYVSTHGHTQTWWGWCMMRMMVDEDDASHKGKSLGDKCSLTVPLKYQFHGQTVLHDHQLQGWVDEKSL